MPDKKTNIRKIIKKSRFPIEKKYLLIDKNRYNYISPSKKGDNWIDYIFIYKGIFSLWRPIVKIQWIYSKSKIRRVSQKQLDILREEEYCFKNNLDLLTEDSLILLESDLKEILE